MSKLDNNDSIQNTVIRGGFCVGCGACSVIKGSNYRIALDDYGRYQAIINNNHKTNINEGDILKVCPFSGVGQDENQLSETLFDKSMPVDKGIGKYLSLYAGYVAEDNYRATGSSGGIVTWMLIQLLHSHKIDAAIHVTQNSSSDNNESLLFKYSISRCEEEIKNGAKSRYYPVEMSSVLKRVLDEPGRYAIVGVPCFIKAVRLLMQNNEILNERIAFCISLVCGHLKSTRFAELMATQMYDNDIQIGTINFRQKLETGYANQFAVSIESKGYPIIYEQKLAKDLFGSDWGMGFFKYQSCDYCDDVFGETADLTAGDAWNTKYDNDAKGANIVITRNPILDEILVEGINSQRLVLESFTPKQVNRTQEAGLRHRRKGLEYRLYLIDKIGLWRPKKRVEPKMYLFERRFRNIQIMRMLLARESHLVFHELFKSGLAKLFEERMRPLVYAYKSNYNYYLDHNRIANYRVKILRKVKVFLFSLFYLNKNT